MYEGIYDTRKGLSDQDAALVGAMTARLLATWDRWVNRRVERVTFCDADALRRDVSVDFTLPLWFHDRRKAAHSVPRRFANRSKLAKVRTQIPRRQLIPLAFLRKGILVNFSMRDEAGNSLPLLTSAQNAQVAEAVLLSLATRILGDVPKAICCDIRDVVRESHNSSTRPSPAEIAHNSLFNNRDHALPQREALGRYGTFTSAASTFVKYFLALSMLDIYPTQRRIIHFSYEEPLHESVGKGPRHLFSFVRRIAFGEARVLAFGAPAVSQSHSYHFEVESPDGHMITARESFLYDFRSPKPVRTQHTGSLRRAHFHMSHLKPGSKAAFLIHVRPRPYTIVRGATGTCLLALLAIGIVTSRYGALQGAITEIAAAVLLSFAGLASLFAVRDGEQDIATSLLFPLRTLLAAPVGLTFCAALVVLAQPSVRVGQAILSVFTLLTLGVLIVLVRNWWSISRAMRKGPNVT
jgi:hypothetical protein